MEYTEYEKSLIGFLDASPTCFHAVGNIRRYLEGYTELEESRPWKLEPGGRYYVTRNGSSLISFRIPCRDFTGFQIVASHTDSPTFKIKENPEKNVKKAYVQLNTEKYGGMIFTSWMDRPLAIAGRVMLRDKDGKIITRLIRIDRDMVIIPSVAIHMNRQVNDGYKFDPQVDMLPLYGCGEAAGKYQEEIAEEAHVSPEDVLGADLFLYNRARGTKWGTQGEFISSPRLDDLECVFTSLLAYVHSEDASAGSSVPVYAVFDNEEVGSGTKQGADSDFLLDTLRRVNLALGRGEEGYFTSLASSFMVSADNAHAVHPNHPEYSDPTNQVFMNQGIVIKHNANQKYTTDAVSAAVFKAVCQKAGVPFQTFVNRSDMAGGSTLGNISNSHVSLNTVDIGLAQLSMHSSYETAGTLDIDYMVRGLTAFYRSAILAEGNGSYSIISTKG